MLIVHDCEGDPIDAHFQLEVLEGQLTLIFHSRGGSRGAKNERNSDYAAGLAEILRRLAEAKIQITNSVVDSSTSKRQGLSMQERQLHIPGGYPITVSEYSHTDELRKLLCSAQRPVGRAPEATGAGNNTKRIRLYLSAERDLLPYFEDFLAGSSPQSHTSVAKEIANEEFDPTNVVDAREKIMYSIANRQGQPQFRMSLLSAYESRCAMSGCSVVDVLEAAHIIPYRGLVTNHVSNGLLLRADIHTLFDRGFVAIDTTVVPWRILTSQGLFGTEYEALSTQLVAIPANNDARPNELALTLHRNTVFRHTN